MKKNYKTLRKNIPSKVKFGPKTFYEVLWIENFSTDKDGWTTHGETRYELKQMVLNNNQPPKETVHTYFHEFLHGISYELDSNLTETQVRALEKGFNAFREFFLTLEGNNK